MVNKMAEKTLEELEEEAELISYQIQIAEEKAALKAAKAQYGGDWKRMIGKNVVGWFRTHFTKKQQANAIGMNKSRNKIWIMSKRTLCHIKRYWF
jgi:hypothetical protein